MGRFTPNVGTLNYSSGAEERSGTKVGISLSKEISKEKESVQSENIPSLIKQKISEKSEESQDMMSEKILTCKPCPIVCAPIPKITSHPSSSDQVQVLKYGGPLSLSAPATASVTPQHESPQAGSSNRGSQIIPTSKSEATTKACDIYQPTPADCVLSAAATSLATSSQQPSNTNSCSDQRSRSKSLHGTQKPITGLFRERKRSKSKTKIDSRSLKLQEKHAPSQMSMSNFSKKFKSCNLYGIV